MEVPRPRLFRFVIIIFLVVISGTIRVHLRSSAVQTEGVSTSGRWLNRGWTQMKTDGQIAPYGLNGGDGRAAISVISFGRIIHRIVVPPIIRVHQRSSAVQTVGVSASG
jgi:hypothetical protein